MQEEKSTTLGKRNNNSHRKKDAPTATKYHFTQFINGQEECKTLDDLISVTQSQWQDHKDEVHYIVMGKEIAPTTNLQHIQGFLTLKTSKPISWVKKFLKDNTAHIEKMTTTVEASIAYCKKEGQWTEIGKLAVNAQGTRSDLVLAWNAARNGSSLNDMLMSEDTGTTVIRYVNGMRAMVNAVRDSLDREDRPIKIKCFFGESGTGKTTDALSYLSEKCGGLGFVFDLDTNSGDGYAQYSGERGLIINEFTGGLKLGALLKWLDDKTMNMRVLFGTVSTRNLEYIVITSNKAPYQWYGNANREQTIALFRRFDEFVHYSWDKTNADENVVIKHLLIAHDKTQFVKPVLPQWWYDIIINE